MDPLYSVQSPQVLSSLFLRLEKSVGVIFLLIHFLRDLILISFSHRCTIQPAFPGHHTQLLAGSMAATPSQDYWLHHQVWEGWVPSQRSGPSAPPWCHRGYYHWYCCFHAVILSLLPGTERASQTPAASSGSYHENEKSKEHSWCRSCRAQYFPKGMSPCEGSSFSTDLMAEHLFICSTFAGYWSVLEKYMIQGKLARWTLFSLTSLKIWWSCGTCQGATCPRPSLSTFTG